MIWPSLSTFYFVGDIISAYCFKYEITPSVKANDRLKFDKDVAFNRVGEKLKPQFKVLYKLLKELYGYDTLLEISKYPTLIQLKKT